MAATVIGLVLTTTSVVPDGVAVFIFVLSGWVLSLICHEFAHAYTAWRGGDHSIAARGYLSGDPRLYADPVTSLLIPIVLVLAGGIGLPGGAVWVDRSALESPAVASAVSLAGPFSNLVCAGLCFIPLQFMDQQSTTADALAFLGFLQVTAFVLNMLPVPGLDGFGAIEPHLSNRVLTAIAPFRRWGLLVLFIALWVYEPFRSEFWSLVLFVIDALGVDRSLIRTGFDLFQFWR